MTVRSLDFPVKNEESLKELKCADRVLIYGNVIAARDSTLSEIIPRIKANENLPFQIPGSCLFLSSVSVIDKSNNKFAVGPTSTYRMESNLSLLLSFGLKAVIGKGAVSDAFLSEMLRMGCVYLGFPGGLSALISRTVKDATTLSHGHLGNEALCELTVSEMPSIVFADLWGDYIFRG
ncbi:fumarate hydratase C-terminal domain-containing protein [candidate division WOR-3 bacterium]|nr:fumarate hydratase C-terminal domain-containing protein [candidate division WOR-3 bacterium]